MQRGKFLHFSPYLIFIHEREFAVEIYYKDEKFSGVKLHLVNYEVAVWMSSLLLYYPLFRGLNLS